jgi:ABC-type nitrate/sulfonate/bicarbonate transport system substrate-binding protein
MRSPKPAIIAASLLLAIAFDAAAAPQTIRVDWAVTPGQFAPLIPTVPQYGPDVYRHYGKSYIVEPIRLQGGGASLSALAAGETDLSTLSPQTLVLGVVNAKLDIKVIAQQISTEVPGYLNNYFWVRADEVKTIADLKGRVIAVPARNSNIDSSLHTILARVGMTEPRDYQLVEIRFPVSLVALESRKVDATALVPPWSVMAAKNSELKKLFNIGEAAGAVEAVLWMATERFIAAHRAQLVDMLEDNIRMRRWMFDPKTRMDAIRQVADFTKTPIETYAGWMFTRQDYYYDPHALVDVARLQKNIEDMSRAGTVPASIDVRRYVDLSLAREAAARVGK